jgi:hypothetical protein
MFGHMKAQPILTVPTSAVEPAVTALVAATENAHLARWIEFPSSILLFAIIPGDQNSGALYVFDRKSGVWFWIDFEDEEYGGYRVSDFDLLIHEYDILSLVERPGLLKAAPGLILESGKPAEMAAAKPSVSCSSAV